MVMVWMFQQLPNHDLIWSWYGCSSNFYFKWVEILLRCVLTCTSIEDCTLILDSSCEGELTQTHFLKITTFS